MRLIITRHGETEENKKGIIQGHLPGKLSKLGIEQTKKLALRLKDEKIDYIFSSDLARASNTAKEIKRFHSKTPIKFVKDLRERYLGDFQGKKRGPRWEEVKLDLKTAEEIIKKAGVERLSEILERAKKFLETILEDHQDKTVLLLGHRGINQAIITVILEKSWEDIMEVEEPLCTAVTIFEVNKNKKSKMVLMNCIQHLK